MALAEALKLSQTESFLSGQGLPKTPKGYIGLAEKAPAQKELLEAQTQAEKNLGMADIEIEKEKQAQTIRDLEGQQLLAEKTAKDIRNLPEREALKSKRDEFADMKFVPTKDTAKDLAGLFSLINVIGVAMGGGGKQAAVGALGAMNGMLEGYQKGRADLYKKEKDIFDKNFKVMQETVKTLEKDYEEAIKMYQYDKEAADIARKIALAKAGSPLFKAMENRIGFVSTLNTIKQLASSLENGATIQNNLAKAEDDRKARKEAAQQAADLRRDLAQIQAGQKIGTAGPRFNIYEKTGKLLPTDKEALAVQSTSTALREINSLRERLKDPEIDTGLRSYPAPLLQKLKSLIGQPLSENEVRQFAEENLTGNDKTTLFIKDAILAGFKVEQGLTGTRVPVFTQKVVGPILDPRNYTPETYDKLLATREKDLFNTGEDYGFTKEDMSKIARIGAAAKTSTPSVESEIPRPTTKEEFDALPKSAIYIDPDDGKKYRK